MNINKAIIIGRITQDLELKSLSSGTNVLNFSVATNYVYRDATGNKVESTEFHNIVTFGKQAETIAQYFVKGQEIYVEGRLQTRSWEDKDSGKKMYRTEIVMEKFDFGARPGASSGQNFEKQQSPVSDENQIEYPKSEDEIDPEDIPF